MKVVELSLDEVKSYSQQIAEWSDLWWPEIEEAGIERCCVALDDKKVVGFQTINLDGLCVAIEVHSDYQGKGIARHLIQETGCTKPEANENPEFWEKIDYEFN